MWTCKKCGRVFEKTKQPHSCKIVPIGSHFENKLEAKELFDHVVKLIEDEIGESKIISLPCCIHLFGKYDFLAALPKKDSLEIRFALDRQLETPKLTNCVQLSLKSYKNCIHIQNKDDIDKELLGWIKESYHLKD